MSFAQYIKKRPSSKRVATFDIGLFWWRYPDYQTAGCWYIWIEVYIVKDANLLQCLMYGIFNENETDITANGMNFNI